MSTIEWSEAQKEAIKTRGRDILVSAAAGSGKTAVLVERVIRKITDPQSPVDIDRLVVVTFTRAAAAQMKGKIFEELRKALRQDPENGYLRQQMMKVQNARICTIDSLCGEIVRDHIQDIDLEPGFRMAEDAQIRMIYRDVLSGLLEEKYQEKDEDFLQLTAYYTDKNDSSLEKIILQIYEYAQSHPEPEVWLQSITIPYEQAESLYGSEEAPRYPDGMENWMPEFAGIVSEYLEEIRDIAQTGYQVSQMEYGPAKLGPRFVELMDLLDQISGECLDNRRSMIEECIKGWKRAPSIAKDGSVDETLKEIGSECLKTIKERLKKLQKDYLYADLEDMFSDMAECLPVVRAIRDLTIAFGQAVDRVKREKKIADFSDIAHYALKVLISYDEQGAILRDENGDPVYTEVADQMAQQIAEVVVDEYQDTNMLQEYLVRALSAQRFGRCDVFMVGDVKQSIYGFRMACPELFLQKSAACREGTGYMINLDRNFRSRREVLNLTNRVFEQVMIPAVGGTDYQNGHALKYGKKDETADAPDPDFIPEILMIEGSGEQAKMQEAYRIAVRIEELVSEGKYHFSDIVILTRTADNPQLEKILYQRGIPVVKNTGKGFFDSLEVKLAIDLLTVIDNPLQDIPLAAVLYSPLCGASADDLARIRLAGGRGCSLYSCLRSYQETDRFHWLLEKLPLWQDLSAYTGICEFLSYILEDSGLNRIIAAMPQGADRRANLEFLKDRAAAFVREGSSGLFSFLRYIRQLKDNGIDYGSAAAINGAEAVRMMTIHRSKGLEFPVVILACSGKQYNEMDIRSFLVPHRTLGLGIEYRDTDQRLIRETMLLQTIRQRKKKELYAEEMRLLYVAMTRTMEKLIIVGTQSRMEAAVKKWENAELTDRSVQTPWEIMRANSYLKLLGMTLHRDRNQKELLHMEYVSSEEPEAERAVELIRNHQLRAGIEKKAMEAENPEAVRNQCEYRYPFENAVRIPGKLSASSLEKFKDRSNYQTVRPESEDGRALTGAERGSAYHKFLELYDFAGDDFMIQLKQMQDQGRMEPEACASIDPERIRMFLDSSLGQRMTAACQRGELVREKQFVIGYIENVNSGKTLTGPGLKSEIPDEELRLIQGRIDAYFTEPDKSEESGPDRHIILVDFKSDKVTEEQYYRDSFTPQLQVYADVLERSTGLKVTERIIYSLESGKEIRL